MGPSNGRRSGFRKAAPNKSTVAPTHSMPESICSANDA